MIAFDAVEAVEAFPPEVDFLEFGVGLEPFEGCGVFEVIEAFSAGKEEFADGGGSFVSGDGFSIAGDDGVKKLEDVEFIGDEGGVGDITQAWSRQD